MDKGARRAIGKEFRRDAVQRAEKQEEGSTSKRTGSEDEKETTVRQTKPKEKKKHTQAGDHEQKATTERKIIMSNSGPNEINRRQEY